MFCKDFSELCVWNNIDIRYDEITGLYNDSTVTGKDFMIVNRDNLKLKYFPQKIFSFIRLCKSNRYRDFIIRKNDYEKFVFPKISLISGIYFFISKIVKKGFINNYFSFPNLKEPFFIFPLHYEDDAQITFREPFLDQISLIKAISRALPLGYYLYVKPHPHYFGLDIDFKGIIEISKIKNVKILYPTFSTVYLLKYAKGVITINSTAGFESLIFGKPVITFGHDFYCKPEFCFIIGDINQLPEIIMKVVANSQIHNYEEIKSFFKRVYSNTIFLKDFTIDEFAIFEIKLDDGKKIANTIDLIINSFAEKSTV
jgi:hypothetical protein